MVLIIHLEFCRTKVQVDNNLWMRNYTSLTRPDELTLARFMGDPEIYSPYQVDLESIRVGSYSASPSLDGGNLELGSSEQNRSGRVDILFMGNVPSHLKEVNLIRIRDSYDVPISIRLRLLRQHERVSWNVPG
ncbi:hypothetical protein Adt_03196 [Abeliophyllum distichum]|uniref:Uncharacterized protein n=1 Tax=Abeliophyllum distichum TaxID=126358 RepID=A0ABD1VXU5_9LAMI